MKGDDKKHDKSNKTGSKGDKKISSKKGKQTKYNLYFRR